MNKFLSYLSIILGLSIILASCGGGATVTTEQKKRLANPLGFPKIVEKTENGETVKDTFPHTIREFSFTNQDSNEVNSALVKNKVYIADFFFTSCPTICPKVKKQMKRVYKAFKDEKDFQIISHSIDTKYDTIGRLAWYAEKFKISSDSWHLVTGDKKEIYDISYDYLASALEDKSAPGGFDHSGGLTLIDRWSRVRHVYDGLDPEKVDQLIQDIPVLLRETSPDDMYKLREK